MSTAWVVPTLVDTGRDKDKMIMNYTDKFQWSSITGDKYWAMKDILDDPATSDAEKEVELVSLVTGLDEETIWNLPLDESLDLINKLAFLNSFSLIPNFKPKYINTPSFKLKVLDNIARLTYVQFVDYQQYMSRPLRDSYDKLLSIFLIPDKCSYNSGYDIAEVQRELREYLGWREIQSLLNFFLKRSVELLHRSLTCYQRQMKKS